MRRRLLTTERRASPLSQTMRKTILKVSLKLRDHKYLFTISCAVLCNGNVGLSQHSSGGNIFKIQVKVSFFKWIHNYNFLSVLSQF